MGTTGFVGRRQGAQVLSAMFFGNAGTVAGLFALGQAPSDGAAGSFAGRAPKGSLLSDTANGVLYINTGTREAPVWAVVGSQGS